MEGDIATTTSVTVHVDDEAMPQNTNTDGTPSKDTTTVVSRQLKDRELSFTEKIARHQKQLEDEFQSFATTHTHMIHEAELDDVDWDELQSRYDHEMEAQIAAERDIMNDFSAHFKQFTLWMQVSNEKEADRAIKRLRTRTAFVRNSEEQLAARQEHYAKVLGAFQDAVALLGNL